jgi:hypothetical protein
MKEIAFYAENYRLTPYLPVHLNNRLPANDRIDSKR